MFTLDQYSLIEMTMRDNSASNSQQINDLMDQLGALLNAQHSEIANLRLQQNLMPLEESSLGETIRVARKEQGLSQDALAMLSGVSKVTVNKLENGGSNVTFDSLSKVFNALGLSLWIGK